MKKYIFSFIMCFCFLVLSSTHVMAEESDDSICISGINMHLSDFKDNFGVAPNERPKARSAFNVSTIKLSNIVVDEENINLNIELMCDDSSVILPVEGLLRAGYKTQHDFNSSIIEVRDEIFGYQILLFEIFNDTAANNLLVNNSIEGQEHIKIYIKDKENNILLFESAMPDELKNINAEDYSKADKEKDALWASPYVEHIIEEIPANNELLTNREISTYADETNPSIWSEWRFDTYRDSFYIGTDLVVCESQPYVVYRYANVRSQDTSWSASFKVEESMTCGGYTYYDNNTFEYRNLKIKLGCGDKTTFIKTEQEGRVYKYTGLITGLKEEGEAIAIKLLDKAVSTLPYGSTFSTVLNAMKNMTSSTGNVTLGSTGISLLNRKTVAVGEDLDGYSIEECTDHSGYSNIGHYFTFFGVLQYEAGNGNTNTVGAISVEFDKYYTGDSSYTPVKEEIQLNYSSQP